MSDRCEVVVVTGAGGFLGGHLARSLRSEGRVVVGVDWREPEFFSTPEVCDEFHLLDLRQAGADAQDWPFLRVLEAYAPARVYHLAADMGGMGFIDCNHASILYNNMLIDLHVLEACRRAGVERVLYASSACVYPTDLQASPGARGLKESDAWPARPQGAYGLEKLCAEELCGHYSRDFEMDVRVVRLHNAYGPFGAWTGGREKAPAALCRKVAESTTGEVKVWGSGEQTRSFMFVDDAVEGLTRAMDLPRYHGPLNLGSEERVTISELVAEIAKVAGKAIRVVCEPGPEGVGHRNSDNSELRAALDFEPRTRLRSGLKKLYPWIAQQLAESKAESKKSPCAPPALGTVFAAV